MYRQRHSGIFDLEDTQITIIGLGGIGSFAATTLARMGANLKLFDGDNVEEVNIGTQCYNTNDIELPKALMCATKCKHISGNSPYYYTSIVTPTFDTETIFSPIIISAVDSLKTRQELWPLIKKTHSWYIDTRMAAELFTMYTLIADESNRAERYEEMLFSKSPGDIPPVPCTEKATAYTGSFAAGWIATAIRHLTTDKPFPYMLSHDIMGLSIKTL